MTHDEAEKILANSPYYDFRGEFVLVDGEFTIRELEALVFLMQNPLRPEPQPDPLCPTCGGTRSAPLGPDGCPDTFHNLGGKGQ